jgi:hypothetical protein
LFIATTLADSEYPTIFSGEINFMKGNSDDIAILAANAVLPLSVGPNNIYIYIYIIYIYILK